jgi:tRNA-uridine 2-sulfurtransferase
MKKSSDSKIVYVAMSGGVDSSVSAALLKERGFEVYGVYMNPWRPFGTTCRADQDEADARAVAKQLNIPFETWDFSAEYGALVADPMIESYRTGTTPNPDIGCNHYIKFGFFYHEALKRGADFVATGHYAETKNGKLFKGKDPNKDQTYFLWTLTKEQLEHTLFPVGGIIKPEVRKCADRFGLVVAKKKDSQGVCFIGMLDMKDFLKTRIPSVPGDILNTTGKTIGTHDGAAYYTIGQRHGMDIKNGDGPYFVVAKDMQRNTVTVGVERDLLSSEAHITDLHWISGQAPTFPLRVMAKLRYRTRGAAGTLSADGHLVLDRPQRAITSGQSAVFFSGRMVLGGGVIR